MSSLDLFSVPSTDYDLQGYKMVPYHKLSASITPMKFSVQALEDYVDLNRSYFVVDLRLSTAGQNGIVADENAASNANNTKFTYAVNNLVHTIFKQINVRFNGTLMTEQTDTYAYSAYLQTLLNYSQDDGETLLAPQGWVNFLNVTPTLAAAGVNDDICTTNGYGHGNSHLLKTLTVPFYGNNVVRLIMRPYLPMFHTGKVMVPGVEMNFEFHFHSPDFYTFATLTSGTGVKSYVRLREEDVDITLHLCRLNLNPDVYGALERQRKLSKQVVKYPVVSDQIRTFSFNGATTVWMEDNLFLGRVPQRMIVGILDSTAFNGTKEKYPFSFQSKGVTSIRQFIEGEEYPYVTLEFAGNNTLKDWEGYRRFLDAAGSVAKHREFMVKPGDWGHNKNCTLYMWNNVPSGNADGPKLNPKQTGNVRLEIKFRAALNTNMTILVWGEFESVIYIDHLGAVTYDNKV
ncbi:unnamed protein product [Porites lobata]|uniref:Major capsid protein n=1 Tax=Porites lobata TaxID=104759 RepID=A0ABN8SAU8_9CNID|nr:unnamed protein product [Porites lobata]